MYGTIILNTYINTTGRYAVSINGLSQTFTLFFSVFCLSYTMSFTPLLLYKHKTYIYISLMMYIHSAQCKLYLSVYRAYTLVFISIFIHTYIEYYPLEEKRIKKEKCSSHISFHCIKMMLKQYKKSIIHTYVHTHTHTIYSFSY